MIVSCIRIESPYFTAGITQTGNTRKCAPILSYMRAWDFEMIEAYCERKGWSITILGDTNEMPK